MSGTCSATQGNKSERRNSMRKLSKQVPLLGTVMLFLTSPVFATTGTTGLPWEAPLQTLQNSISGPVAVTNPNSWMAANGGQLIFRREGKQYARHGRLA